MARPGFNGSHWLNLPFEEALVFGWLGQRISSTQKISSLRKQISDDGLKIASFHDVDETSFRRIQKNFEETSYVVKVLDKLIEKTNCIEHFEIADDEIAFKLSQARLKWEIDFLKKRNIQTVVTLTENHNQKEDLQDHFDLHHLAIKDLNAPQFEQALELAEIIRKSQASKKGVVVHCMAGIGRTSTMIIAAHLVLGEKLEVIRSLLEKQNPTFKLTESQTAFVQSVADRMHKA